MQTEKPDTKFYGKVPPDRLSIEKGSPYFNEATLRRIGVKFNGVVQTRVVEYCISEGWIRIRADAGPVKLNKHGMASGAFKRFGKVEVVVNPR